MAQVWFVTVPNDKESSENTFSALQKGIATSSNGHKLYRIEIPNLVVGTLDSLISLSDDLTKIGTQVENVVRKVERQYAEIAGQEGESLRVNETSVETFLKKFSWDFAQYQHQGRQLSEIVGQIQSMTGKIEEDLKMLSTTYTEKSLALATTKRKKQINLTTSDLEDFLSPQEIQRLDPLNGEHLVTVLVVVPRQLESEFLQNYATLGESIAAYGGPEWGSFTRVGQNDGRFGTNINRSEVQGSPVVPDSHQKVREEGDSVMYAITILKGHYQAGTVIDDVFTAGQFVDYLEPIKAAYRDKRFIIRDLTYNAAQAGGVDSAIEHGEAEMKQIKNTVLRWCKSHFGEAYSGWMHLKLIQGFVESVLRYGLPVDFSTILIEPNVRLEKDLRKRLNDTILQMRPMLKMKKMLQDDMEEEEDDDMESLPYVCLKCPVIGGSG